MDNTPQKSGLNTAIILLTMVLVLGLTGLFAFTSSIRTQVNSLAQKDQERTEKAEVAQKSGMERVKEDRLQAVFLNNNQTYFGNITEINQEYLVLENVYYLKEPGSVDISLVKLGCELHRPEDTLQIYKSQVLFWENMKEDNGVNAVPGAVRTYEKSYPNGQECE